jgi:hypothetical protein
MWAVGGWGLVFRIKKKKKKKNKKTPLLSALQGSGTNPLTGGYHERDTLKRYAQTICEVIGERKKGVEAQ